eukprot:2733382-Prymnesium_polylepis.1
MKRRGLPEISNRPPSRTEQSQDNRCPLRLVRPTRVLRLEKRQNARRFEILKTFHASLQL